MASGFWGDAPQSALGYSKDNVRLVESSDGKRLVIEEYIPNEAWELKNYILIPPSKNGQIEHSYLRIPEVPYEGISGPGGIPPAPNDPSTILGLDGDVLTFRFANGKTGSMTLKVSFEDFKGLVADVEPHRSSRLIDLNTFLKMSKEPGVIILDSRSAFRFDRIHLKGAKHLAFTDFTQDNLRKVIPSFDTKILIYCNNNFDGNQTDFASKIALPPPTPTPNKALTSQLAAQAKPLMMALNIPTYINLYGYGYRNVYELDELVKVNDPRISFEGSIVEPQPAPPASK